MHEKFNQNEIDYFKGYLAATFENEERIRQIKRNNELQQIRQNRKAKIAIGTGAAIGVFWAYIAGHMIDKMREAEAEHIARYNDLLKVNEKLAEELKKVSEENKGSNNIKGGPVSW